MATRTNTSPSINFTETNNTFDTQNISLGTKLGISGEFMRGKAFTPIEINSFGLFERVFGTVNPCLFEGTQQPKYEGAYIAKQYLQEGNQLSVVRVLGLSGYDAGDAWGISLGGALDESTITTSGTTDFTLNLQYVNGNISSVEFSDTLLQSLYDDGQIPNTVFGGSTVETGTTITQNPSYIGNCETFEGSSFIATVLTNVEKQICITGSTEVGSFINTTQQEQTCEIIYSGGTVSYNSTFFIEVTNGISLINQGTNQAILVEPPAAGNNIMVIQGGTITHDTLTSITTSTDTVITLPNGDTYTGGIFYICDFNNNNAYYSCDDFDRSSLNYTEVTGSTTITVPVFSGTTQQIISQIPAGIVDITMSGTGTFYTGSPLADYDGAIAMMLRSIASYSADETLSFNVSGNVMVITSIDGNVIKPLDNFKLSFYDKNGKTYEFITSLDRRKSNYLPRIFGNFELCCSNNLPLYVEEGYPNTLEQLVDNNLVYCIKPTVCYLPNFDNYKDEYRGAVTPWLISELQGNSAKKLFRVHNFSDGNIANEEIKISIENIRPDANTFDLLVRSFSDSDSRPTILESYRRLTLREDSNNFIGRRIGTSDGSYEMVSNYITVEIASDCQGDYVPAGFMGYPIRDYNCGQIPDIFYKTEYNAFENKRKAYLGLSETLGFDLSYFTYKGLTNDENNPMWTGTTTGFHLDKDASTIEIDNQTYSFQVGNAPFQNEADTVGTDYEKLNARKFSLAFYGGFDGWDIHRKRRTNTDDYRVNGVDGREGLVTGAFDTYSNLLIGDGANVINSDYYAYLLGIRQFADKDTVDINLFTTPNVNTVENSSLVEETIEMIEEERCDAFYVITTPDTTPEGDVYSPDDISGLLDGLYDTSWAATYYPWGQLLDEVNNVRLWLPPTCEVVRNMVITDKIAAPWFAPAGTTRGLTQFIQPRFKLSQEERDTLFDARINPIRKLKATNTNNVYIWSQKTLDIQESDLDRINIRRLLISLREQIEASIIDLVFEQNDITLREQFTSLVTPILVTTRDQRGIFDYRIQVDDSLEALQTNRVTAKIGIKATKSVEFFDIDFVLTPINESFDNN